MSNGTAAGAFCRVGFLLGGAIEKAQGVCPVLFR